MNVFQIYRRLKFERIVLFEWCPFGIVTEGVEGRYVVSRVRRLRRCLIVSYHPAAARNCRVRSRCVAEMRRTGRRNVSSLSKSDTRGIELRMRDVRLSR